ncbi:TOMM precursor leader peptide-binding protein [Streptomyces profundus]|uniref:TOMM precursor leader peptide-binding protein n=1 Tax=Streptomyces profundus TaxID=2867410 RepID=UPI001D16DC5C|nr:TOMM precursor leader peptide-binding protein [Streptomyces sp. MA3_2.13]UED87399.1 TOMM precursor leader peptide-binding protein [Streptomyces sp. MA3_2.13]
MATAFDGLAGIRPRLRRDVLFTQTPGGVLFHNADGGFHLMGRTAYRFASLIVPHLDGGRPLAEICAGLGEQQRAMVAELVNSLLERDFARDVRPATGPGPEGDVAERFAAQIAYVDHYRDDAGARFTRFRDTRVAVLGEGETAAWCALSLVRNGCAEIAVESPAPRAEEEARELADAGCPVAVTPLAPGAGLAGYDVLVVTGADAAARTHRLLGQGLAENQLLIPAWTFGNRVVVGPRSGPASTSCLGCALLRLGDTTDLAAATRIWSELAGGAVAAPAAPGGPLAGPVAAMVGNLLGYEIFRTTTGALPAETDGAVLIQDLDSLDVIAEPLRPHPRCPRCADAAEPGELGEELTVARTVTVESARDAEELVAGLNRLSDAVVRPHAGVFTRYDDETLTQTPLKVTRVEVPLGAHGTRLIAAFDVHHLAGARQRALRAAAGVYEEHAVPATVATELPAGIVRLTPDQLIADGGLGAAVDSWTLVTSLLTKEQLAVPTAAVRPLGPPNRDRLVLPGSWGSGAGETSGEAAGHALLSALAHEALLRAVRGAAPARALPVDDRDAGPELVFLGRSAGTLSLAVELLDLSDSAPAPVVLARERGGAGRWAVSSALTREDASVAALRDLLGQAQLAAETGEDPDTGDSLLGDLAPATIPVTGPAEAVSPVDFPTLLERLRTAGQDVLHRDTTPADLRSAGLHTARVVLTKAAGHAPN